MSPEGETPLWPWLTPRRAGLTIALLWLAFGLASLPRFGLSIDSPALFYAGDRTLFWIGHPSLPGALDFAGPEPVGFQSEYGRFPVWADPMHYPVFPDLVAAVTAAVFHRRLGWLSDLDGHHLGLVLLQGLGLFLFCAYACRLLGRGAGIAAAVALALYPSAVGHAMNNPKDWPCAMFYGVAVLAAGAGLAHGRARDVLAAAVLLGVALACRANAIFAAATIVAWTPLAWLLLWRRRRPLRAPLVAAWLGAPFVAAAVFIVLWPWLYEAGLGGLVAHLRGYVTFLSGYGRGPRASWTDYPLRGVLFMTPPLVLAAAALQILQGFRAPAGDAHRVALANGSLLLLWTAVPLLRVAMPHSNFYDANRHYIEYVPGLCAMAGAGAARAASIARGLWRRAGLAERLWPRALVGSSVLAAALLVWPLAVYHPYETCYFNDLIGGLGGAQARRLFSMPPPQDARVNGTEGDYWYNSMREAMDRLYPQVGDRRIRFGVCGASPALASADAAWRGSRLIQIDYPRADYVMAVPRESYCNWGQIRSLEATRPVIARAEREGGLIYELFGPRR